ncbi:hypothetical protein TcWFU_004201 [Taenia crassiceps]|uniref:DUF5727 domain-containing protein n=1 Tax=Taenia crassiceps TaxID=6207 RepID=A0ABR4Q7U5_9CEST
MLERSGADPVLWGSRVDGTPNGPSPPMYFRLSDGAQITVLSEDGSASPIDVREGVCYLAGEVWGRPCQRNGKSANLTLLDVSKQKALLIRTEGSYLTAYFVPNCTFQKPQKDGIDLATSFPLSRFRKGESHVELKFAVQGANSQSQVSLGVDGNIACRWIGCNLQLSKSPFCRVLSKDAQSDLRVLVVNFTRSGSDNYNTLEWFWTEETLAVTVDWTQEGESPEVGECKERRSSPLAPTHARSEMTYALTSESVSSGTVDLLRSSLLCLSFTSLILMLL